MYKLPQYDMYDFIDDGVNKSIYTILNDYHPNLEKDFSLANLINCMVEVGTTKGQIMGFSRTYEKEFERLADLLLKKTRGQRALESDGEQLPAGEIDRIFNELKGASEELPDCKSFTTLRQYLEYAKQTMQEPEKKPLRDAIVTNAAEYVPQEEANFTREVILKTVYLSKAEEIVRAVNHKSRAPGEYPEWDKLQAIRQILQKNKGLEEYDAYYEEASAHIRDAALKAMAKAKTETVCKRKRYAYVKKAINPSISSEPAEAANLPISAMFEEEKLPRRDANRWAYESLKTPELLCDLEANYSENGIENQRVIAFRYGRLKYKRPDEIEGFNIDRTSEMPELIGISRIGKDGTKNYFVLMDPIDRLTFRPVGEKPQEPGEKPYGFTITEDVQIPTRSGKTVIERQTRPANIVDGRTGQRLNAFKNKEIPEELKEFFAKVFFSDEYLQSAIENNARYIGSVVLSDKGPIIRSTDIERFNLQAAHYATYYPGTIDRISTKSFERYCTSFELDTRQYNLVYAKEKESRIAQRKNVKPEAPADQGDAR